MVDSRHRIVRRGAALLAALLLTCCGAAAARAVTLDIAPSPAVVGGRVTYDAGVQWSVTPTARDTVDFRFGDGASRTVAMSAAICTPAGFCRPSATHVYAAPGSYRVVVEASSSAFAAPPPTPPNPVIRTLVVNAAPPGPPPPPVVAPALSVAPLAHVVPFGQESLRRVTWAVSGAPALSAALVSPGGRFVAGGETVGSADAPLSLGVAGGTGSAPEAIRVPVAVLEAVLAKRLNRFSWVREFRAPGLALTGAVDFTVAAAGAADFRITRLELFFENRQAQITVPRDQGGLRAFATLAFTGAGLLTGRWEVDGRTIADVSRHLAGGTATLETPATPALPTFDPGTHTVRFVPTSPGAPAVLPSMIYFVTPDGAAPAPRPIGLLAPEGGARQAFAPLRFAWSAAGGESVFLVEFLEDPAGQPVFSAYTAERHYTLPGLIFRDLFQPGKRYFWRVTGFDPAANRVGESAPRAFFFSGD